MSAPAKTKYRTTNWKEDNAALKARVAAGLAGPGDVLARQCQRQAWPQPEVQRGAIQFRLTIKGLFKLALQHRQRAWRKARSILLV